jgi:hypothetical protein
MYATGAILLVLGHDGLDSSCLLVDDEPPCLQQLVAVQLALSISERYAVFGDGFVWPPPALSPSVLCFCCLSLGEWRRSLSRYHLQPQVPADTITAATLPSASPSASPSRCSRAASVTTQVAGGRSAQQTIRVLSVECVECVECGFEFHLSLDDPLSPGPEVDKKR